MKTAKEWFPILTDPSASLQTQYRNLHDAYEEAHTNQISEDGGHVWLCFNDGSLKMWMKGPVPIKASIVYEGKS